MTNEVFADGVSEVNIAGGIVRINFVSLSATLKDAKGRFPFASCVSASSSPLKACSNCTAPCSKSSRS